MASISASFRVGKESEVGEVAYSQEENRLQTTVIGDRAPDLLQPAQLSAVPPEEAYLGIDAEGVLGEVFLAGLDTEEQVGQLIKDEAEFREGFLNVSLLYEADKSRNPILEMFFSFFIGLVDPGFLYQEVEVVLKMAKVPLLVLFFIVGHVIEQALVVCTDSQHLGKFPDYLYAWDLPVLIALRGEQGFGCLSIFLRNIDRKRTKHSLTMHENPKIVNARALRSSLHHLPLRALLWFS
jgi:hypothetical protein